MGEAPEIEEHEVEGGGGVGVGDGATDDVVCEEEAESGGAVKFCVEGCRASFSCSRMASFFVQAFRFDLHCVLYMFISGIALSVSSSNGFANAEIKYFCPPASASGPSVHGTDGFI